jgi:CDP-glucose 4,6-dehydratase
MGHRGRSLASMGLGLGFWEGRRVLLTGHTGFKGSWLALWLESLGALVTGLSLKPDTEPSLFVTLEPWPHLESLLGDVRSAEEVGNAVSLAKPEVVIHMAAQAIVRVAYADPVQAFETNVVGTARLLTALVEEAGVKAILVVTSDKVYSQDVGLRKPFVETDPLGSADPYSASKAAQELVAASFAESYLDRSRVRLGTARSGNVIGGGDWAMDRLVPDFVRARLADRSLHLRYPDATRPWQHVLDCLSGYLVYAQALYAGPDCPKSLNFGPRLEAAVSVASVVQGLSKMMGGSANWTAAATPGWPEMPTLELDSARARISLGWRPHLELETALSWTAGWYSAFAAGEDMRGYSLAQIAMYEQLMG